MDTFYKDIKNISNIGEDGFAIGFILRHEIDKTIVSHHCIRRPGPGSDQGIQEMYKKYSVLDQLEEDPEIFGDLKEKKDK